jgi:ABC-2 type transport system permease protein
MRYLSLYWSFFRASLTADMEFRFNFLLRIITDVFWYASQIITFEVLFRFSPDIAGWNIHEMRVFLGVLFVVDAIYMVMFSSNLDNLSEQVRKGSLDLLLAKPVNSQFMISLQRASTAHLGNLLMALIWLVWAVTGLDNLSYWRILWLFIMIPCGVSVFYGLRFFFSATAVIFTRADNIQYLWYHLYKLGMRPDNIYAPWLKMVLLTAVPVGVIAGTPARVVLGLGPPILALWSVVVAAFVLLLTHLMWKFTLRFYNSASS